MNKIKNLLAWCKYHTQGYPNVSVTNFTSSWRNGLAFSALIHRFRPDLINFHDMNPENVYYNNYIVFRIAETHFGIPALLDAKDMDAMENPERLSVITYVSQFHNCLKDMEPEGGPDINKFEDSMDHSSNFERISARASVAKLIQMTCCLCHTKVYLLERYVADDKLYHRKCYRKYQLEHIDSQSEIIIEDYLNIYGSLKSSISTAAGNNTSTKFNKNIFVHPLLMQNDVDHYHKLPSTTEEEVPLTIKTNAPVNLEDNLSQPEESSESLSSYSYTDSDSDLNPIDSAAPERPERTSLASQENIVLNKKDSLKPIRSRLYIKRQDKQLPYSTCFELAPYYPISHDYHDPDEEPPEEYSEPIDETSRELSIENDKNEDNPQFQEQQEPEPISSPKVEHRTATLRKVIQVNFNEEYDSDISSLDSQSDPDNEHSVTVQPQIVRNSVWRKPIVFSCSAARKHRSITVPIENKFKDYYEFKQRLKLLNQRQSTVENRARVVQEALWQEDTSDDNYEALLTEWLTLVEEKDKLFYEENALYSWIKDLKLQEMKRKLEAEIRLLSLQQDKDKEVANLNKEEQLIEQLIDTVNKRSQLVDEMHEENLRRIEMSILRQKLNADNPHHHNNIDYTSKNTNNNTPVIELRNKSSPDVQNRSKKRNSISKLKFWTRKSSNY